MDPLSSPLSIKMTTKEEVEVTSSPDVVIKKVKVTTTTSNRFDWKAFLAANPKCEMNPAPVSLFVNGILGSIWEGVTAPNLKVEYKVDQRIQILGSKEVHENVYWIGTTKQYFGYFAKVEDEGYPPRSVEVPHLWLNFMLECQEMGCCLRNRGVLIPPLMIMKVESDWKSFIMQRLTNKATKYSGMKKAFNDECKSMPEPGTEVEALDFSHKSFMRPAIVEQACGTRVYVRYVGDNGKRSSEDGFWCDIKSRSVAPTGWSNAIGMKIVLPNGYPYSPKPLTDKDFEEEMEEAEVILKGAKVEVGMKLEAVCLPNPSYIVAATVKEVLKYGFIRVSYDGDYGEMGASSSKKKKEESLFCHHVTSNGIFHCGFSEHYGIDMIPPLGCEGDFKWDTYFKENADAKPLPILEVWKESPTPTVNLFEVGMKLEAADLSYPKLVRLATVSSLAGPLIKVAFDGSSESDYQWMDAEAEDMYPVGWCDTFGYKLTGPEMDSEFWIKYTHPTLHKTSCDRRREGDVLAVLDSLANRGTLKRKSEDERLRFNSEFMKADLVKLGRKSTPSSVQPSPVVPSTTPPPKNLIPLGTNNRRMTSSWEKKKIRMD